LVADRQALAGTLTIVPTFDTTITGSANAADIEAAINGSISMIEGLYSTFNSVTDNVYFYQLPIEPLGFNLTSVYKISYADYTNGVKDDLAVNPDNTILATAIANLGKGNDAGGGSPIAATSGLLRSLGAWTPGCLSATGDINCGASDHSFDSIIILGSAHPLDYTRPIPPFPPVEYDAIGIIEHELDEALGGGGLVSTLNVIATGPCPGGLFCDAFGTLDLYRYSAPNTPSFTTSPDATAYFSVDGGTTDIVGFNQNSNGDLADFGPSITPCSNGTFGGPDAFIQDEMSCNNQQAEGYTTASPEYAMLLSIGYDPAAVPEPGTLIGGALLGFAALRRRRQ
jgi:PEP-CTERM motif